MTFQSQQVHAFCWTKTQALIKTKQNQKRKIPHAVLERRTLCFNAYRNRKLKVKLWWIGVRERKKRAFFLPFILSEGNFINNCVLSQCIVYWIHFQNNHTFTYQKEIKSYRFLLVFRIAESLQCILNVRQNQPPELFYKKSCP